MPTVQDWVLERLTCPRDRTPLERGDGQLSCASGHHYPIVLGIPVLLVEEDDPTHPCFAASIEQARGLNGAMSDAPAQVPPTGGVDPWVQDAIVGTNGNLYRALQGRLCRYPIPRLPLPQGTDATLLDIGSNWGRWTIAAAGAGYRPVGIDPSLDALFAGRRVAEQLGVDVGFVVADARRLPFRGGTFDVSFSYSVLQHLDKHVVRQVLGEVSRVTRHRGEVVVQMPNMFGARQMQNRMRQLVSRDANPFRMRYWRPSELARLFGEEVGPARLSVDGYLSLNARVEDLDLLPTRYRLLVRVSERLRQASEHARPLLYVADSLYVRATNERPARTPPSGDS